MTFNNLNYSTADKVDGTIQDLIDDWRITIENLTKDKLKTLKVEILDNKSHLELRDLKWNIIWKLNKWKDLSFLWGKIEHNWKIFLEVENEKWKKWYVSADYVIGDIEDIAPAKFTPAVAPTTKSTPAKSTPTPAPAPAKSAPAPTPATDSVDNNELKYNKKYTIKDGKIFLVWVDWKKIENSEELSPKDKEKLEKFEKLMILNEVLEIWKSEAMNVVDSLYRKEWRKDDDIILAQIEEINKLFWEWFVSIQKWWDLTTTIDTIFDKIYVAEWEESIIWVKDMSKVKEILKKWWDKDQQLIQIFNLMRYKWLSWNKNEIKEKVSNHLLADKKFSDIKTILENPELVWFIENNNSTELEKLIWKEATKEILEAYKKLIREQQKYRDEYAKEYNQLISDWKIDQKLMSLNDYINSKAYYQTFTLLKHTLLRNKVDKMKNRWSEEKSYTWIYANMSWLWTTKWTDFFIISDDNIDTAIDVWSTLALSAVSMWVWAIVARWALVGATWISRVTKLTSWVNKLWKTGWLVKWAWTAWVEWFGFYEWTNLTNNVIYWSNWLKGLGKNYDNKKEILKSIAFMWVLRWVWKVMWTQRAISLTSRVPKLMLKWTSITWVLAEAWLLTWIWYWIECKFEWDAKLTLGEYMQALVMIWLFRWAWRLFKIWRTRSWDVFVEEGSANIWGQSTENNNASRNRESNRESNRNPQENPPENAIFTEIHDSTSIINKNIWNEFVKCVEEKLNSINVDESQTIWKYVVTRTDNNNFKIETDGRIGTYDINTNPIKNIAEMLNADIETINGENMNIEKLKVILKYPSKEIVDGVQRNSTNNKLEIVIWDNNYFIVNKTDGKGFDICTLKEWNLTRIDINSLSPNEINIILEKISWNEISAGGTQTESVNGVEVNGTSSTSEIPKNANFNKIFNKIFDSSLIKEWDSLTIGDQLITYYRWWIRKKYTINWDNKIYSKNEILNLITAENKKIFLEKKAKESVDNLEWEIKLKNWFFNFKWIYKVSKKEIIKIWKNWEKDRILTQEEEKIFYEEHWMELLEKTQWMSIKNAKEKLKKEMEWPERNKLFKAIDEYLLSKNIIIKNSYKFIKYLWNLAKNDLLIIKNPYIDFKSSVNSSEKIKSIIFANKNIWWWKWAWKVFLLWTIPTIAEMLYEINWKWDWDINWTNIFMNYVEFMYWWLIIGSAIEFLNLDKSLNKPKWKKVENKVNFMEEKEI